MKASTKRQFERIPNDQLEGTTVSAVNRSTGESIIVAIMEVTSQVIVAGFKDKFQERTFQFRRDKGTQLGGELRLDVESLLA